MHVKLSELQQLNFNNTVYRFIERFVVSITGYITYFIFASFQANQIFAGLSDNVVIYFLRLCIYFICNVIVHTFISFSNFLKISL